MARMVLSRFSFPLFRAVRRMMAEFTAMFAMHTVWTVGAVDRVVFGLLLDTVYPAISTGA